MQSVYDFRGDLMVNHAVRVQHGTLYRKGCIVQVWWFRDAAGREIAPTAETWTLPNVEQAERTFADMQQRWKEE